MAEASKPPRRRFRLWITLSELVGVLALLIAGLNFWDGHRERTLDARRQDAAETAATRAHTAVVFRASADGDGTRLMLEPANPAEVVQSQRYLFPHAVLGHAMEVTAAKPQVDLVWIAPGLERMVAAARRSGAGAEGSGELPVGLYTTIVEDGEVRTDASLYRLGYAWRSGLFGPPVLSLQGLALVRRGVTGDLRGAVEAASRRQSSTTP